MKIRKSRKNNIDNAIDNTAIDAMCETNAR